MKKNNNKIVLILIVFMILITGCNKNGTGGDTKSISNGSSTKSNTELTIVDSGWSYIEGDFGNSISYGVEIKNPKNNDLADFPKLKIVGRDKENKILFSYDETIDYIYPGETIYYGESYSGIEEKPDKLDITINVENWQSIKSVNFPKNTEFTVSNVSEYKDEDSLKFTGEIENNSSTDIESALIVGILKKDGKIVGGFKDYSDKLKSKQKSSFETYVDDYPEYDNYEISSQVSSIN